MMMRLFPDPRPYQDDRDLERMRAILVKGRPAANGSYYVHVGDLNWWLFYPSAPHDWREVIYLWDGQWKNGDLSGWALLSPEWRAFDVFVHPDVYGSQRAAQMYTWAEERLGAIVQASGGQEIRTMWIFADDTVLAAHLDSRGFSRSADFMHYMQRSLSEPVPEALLPPGYQVRPLAGEHEMERRAAASHAAFSSRLPFDVYCQRYLSFMRSPVYDPSLDLVTEAPDGRFASFCICWLDIVNQVGLFEPVGTHPDFHRQGLGKAVLLEGLRRMRAQGMLTAIVGAESDNPAAQRLYQSVGFRPVNRIFTFVKRIE